MLFQTAIQTVNKCFADMIKNFVLNSSVIKNIHKINKMFYKLSFHFTFMKPSSVLFDNHIIDYNCYFENLTEYTASTYEYSLDVNE